VSTPLYEHERDRILLPDGVTKIRRNPFAHDFADFYKKGEHSVFGGPTTRGKTTLAFDLTAEICTPISPAYFVISKPRDKVSEDRGAALGYRRTPEFPPIKKLGEIEAFGGQKPPGYLVWDATGDLEHDMLRGAELTEAVIHTLYASSSRQKVLHGGVIVLDDTMVKAKLQGQDSNMVMMLAMSGALKLGVWVFLQKPTDSGRTALWAFENATHLFFTRGGDKKMLQRYREILGEHGDRALTIIPTLGDYEFLYVHRYEGWMNIVGAN
jgi:hypothetical protein